MSTRRRQIELLDDADFNDGLGGGHKIPLSDNRYTRKIRLTVDLGTAYETDSKNTEVSWDGDAEEKFFEAVKLNANGERFSVPSEWVNFLNTYDKGVNQSKQLVVDLRVPYKGMVTGEVRGQDFATLRLELDARHVSDLTSSASTPAEYQEGTQVEVTAVEAQGGKTKALRKIVDKVDQLSANDRNDMEFRANGIFNYLIIEEDGADLDRIEVEVNVPGDEIEVVDMSASALRKEMEQDAGTLSLPEGYYFVNLMDDQRFTASDINYVDLTLHTAQNGDGGVVVRSSNVVTPS